MKAYKYIPLLLTVFLGGCYVMDVPDPEQPDPTVKLSLDDDPFSGSETISLDYESSTTLTFEYEDISRIVAEAPLGWSAVVKMTGGSGSIKISAPKYGTESVQDGVVNLKMFDGSGSFSEKKLTVHAVEGVLEFALSGFDTSVTSEFTLGSRTTVNYTCSPSFKELDYVLPAGWKLLEKVRGAFVIVAPDLTVETGDASGMVTITPVSWSGVKETSLAVSFPVNVDPTKPTFQFVEEETNFTYGETKTLEITAKGLKDVVYPTVPEGWTIDWSGINEGTISVTSPASDTVSFDGCASLVLSAISNTDNSPITSNASVIRLYGINSAEEFIDFRTAYEGANPSEPTTDEEVLGKWMVDGVLSLNSDILLTSDMLQSKAYVVKTLDVPFNGNNHTITLDLNCNASVAGLFHYITADVSNLKLAGSLTNSYETGVSNIGSLVATPKTCTIENVESSVNITYNVGASIAVKTNVGGLSGNPASNYSATFKNCKYSGTITLNNDAFGVGGIVSGTDMGKPGGTTTCDGCVFSGEIVLNHKIADSGITPRLGGIIGDLGRIGVITNCVSEGNITVNAGGKRILSSSAGGFGGVVGRNTAPASEYTMSATIKNCSFTGSITVKGTAGNEDMTRYGQIIGCVPNSNAQGALTQESNTMEGTISFE